MGNLNNTLSLQFGSDDEHEEKRSKRNQLVRIPDWVLEILWFLPIHEAILVIISTRHWHRLLVGAQSEQSEQLWAWCCSKLANDYNLYSPSLVHRRNTLYQEGEWRRYFFELEAKKGLWRPHQQQDEDASNTEEMFNTIRVACKFRPAKLSNREFYEHYLDEISGDELENKIRVKNTPPKAFLPLHQRIQLIKATNKNSSTKEAFMVMQQEGSLFREYLAKEAAKEEKKEGVEYSPVDDNESWKLPHQGEFVAKVQAIIPEQNQVVVMTPTAGLREFQFDRAFPIDVPQQEVFETLTDKGRLVADFVNGTNVTMLVFGQTGSGKTYTMHGPDGWSASGHGDKHGLIPRMCRDAIRALEYRKSQANVTATLHLSYVEVYGDQINDLLKGGEVIGTQAAATRYVMEGAAEVVVNSWDDVHASLTRGEEEKRFAATLMNERSSRAHSILMLKLVQHHLVSDLRVTSHLMLADLGGSEQVKKSGVNTLAAEGDPERLKEAVQINMGLLALKQVIQALNARQRHIPYHDSKLTMLLSQGLGGNSKTTVILCGSPEAEHVNDTLNTLRFGEQCACVSNVQKNGVATIAGVIDRIEDEIRRLEDLIKKKEKWVTVVSYRKDTNVEEGTLEYAQQSQGEQVKTSVLQGAEEERMKLEQLVVQRAELRGDNVETALLTAGFAGFGKFSTAAIGSKRDSAVPVGAVLANSRFEGGVEFDNGLVEAQ